MNRQLVVDLLVTAFEGASRAWFEGAVCNLKTDFNPWYADPDIIVEDLEITIVTKDDGSVTVTYDDFEGVFERAEKLGLDLEADEDAADTFLQLAVFGEVQY